MSCNDGPALKKARMINSWEESLANKSKCNLGLEELFGRKRRREGTTHHRNQYGEIATVDGGFFTIRLEKRKSGAVARYPGEERFLLFRSDRAGAIGKIIFSSSAANTKKVSVINSNSGNEPDLTRMTQAKIHVLDIKREYRGRDLGGLLFSEAIASLRDQYQYGDHDDKNYNTYPDNSKSLASSVCCQLDAEEDVQRHNKLVEFYEELGCGIKPNVKIQYLHNNDSSTYRKIPMQITLPNIRTHRYHQGASLIGRGKFLPVGLFELGEMRLGVFQKGPGTPLIDRRTDWLLLENEQRNVQFRTTRGHCLEAAPNGQCSTVTILNDTRDKTKDVHSSKEKQSKHNWSHFRLYRVPDSVGETSSDDYDYDARRKELWMLKSCHGSFLSADPSSHTLSCSKVPTFWQANDEKMSLTCTSDTPLRRQHYRKSWAEQTVEYVATMRARYLEFNIKKMTLQESLNLARHIPCQPFRVDRSIERNGPSVRTLCFRAAEMARREGRPDWIQLIALVHELGAVINRIHMPTASKRYDYDWTISSRSRIVGCKTPSCSSFGEFRSLSRDQSDEGYNSPLGMYNSHCGLEKALLLWTGPEYMYHMLKHNDLAIPEEGLAMLRLFPLGDWHTHLEYQQLTNFEDEVNRPFVAAFDQMRRKARRECNDIPEMTDETCDQLWNEYYVKIAAKYNGGGVLRW